MEELQPTSQDRTNTVGNLGKPFRTQVSYREFVKIFLKLKFEKLDMDHPGQKVGQDLVWKEVIKQQIPFEKWKEFILDELKSYKKYTDKKGG